MKKKGKWLALPLALLMGMSVFAGCSLEQVGEEVDATRTTLRVGTYTGGVDASWLDGVKERFEAKYADTCFEPGTDKKGVQVIITPDKTIYHGSSIMNNIAGLSDAVIFTENVDYHSAAASGLLLDVSDIFGENLSEKFGENKTIRSKMYDEEWEFIQHNGGVYGVPHYMLLGGIQYDVDLFEENNLYFNEAGTGFVRSAAEARSAGPDGDFSTTYDNGLPATYDDFFKLCDEMLLRGITPIAWSGYYQKIQTYYTLWALIADYEGPTNFMANFNFDETVDDIVTSITPSSDGTFENIDVQTKDAEITPETGYELRQQAGYYYAFKFFERIVDGPTDPAVLALPDHSYYDRTTAGSMVSHLGAQENFIKGYWEGSPIGMLCDGAWWENEASGLNGAFETAVAEFGPEASRENHRYGFMPLPKATSEQVGDPYTLANWGQCYGVINKNAVEGDENLIALSKLFLQFCCTDPELTEFTLTTGMPKSFKYDIDDTRVAQEMTYFQQTVWSIYENAELLQPYSGQTLLKNNKSTLGYGHDIYTTVNNQSYGIPVTAFIDTNITAEQYFFGMKMSAEDWNMTYGRDLATVS